MTVARYHVSLRWLHWVMAALLIGLLVAGQSRQFFERGTDIRDVLRLLHIGFGMAIFILVWLRLALRLRWGRPSIEPPLPRWQDHLARFTHGIFYVGMIVLPLLGIALYWTGGWALPVLDVTLSDGRHGQWRDLIERIHVIGGRLITGFIALHLLAALCHHWQRRDDTLKRLLPGPRGG